MDVTELSLRNPSLSEDCDHPARGRSARMRGVLILALALSACATNAGEFRIVLSQTEYPVGWLSDYRGLDAYGIILRNIREYCEGEFHEVHRTASDDGAEHGVFFECSQEALNFTPSARE